MASMPLLLLPREVIFRTLSVCEAKSRPREYHRYGPILGRQVITRSEVRVTL